MSWFGNKESKAARGEPGFWFFLGKRRARTREDNPAYGLTIQRALRLMESYLTGDFADLMWTFAAPWTGIENSDPDYLSIIERRVGAVKEMSWQIRQWKAKQGDDPDQAKEALAEKQAKVLEGAYERMENVTEAIAHLVLARFRGFSIVEPDDANGEFIPVDHWNVRRDGLRGDWYFNETGEIGRELSACTPFDERRIIVMETPRPIGRIALLKYIRANLSEQDWDHFVEIYGIPSGVVIAPEDVDEAKLAEFKRAAADAARGGDAAFPAGSTYIANSGPRGDQPFRPRLEWLSEKLVQAGTGGMLTMLSMPGSGTLAGSAHLEAFKTLARADAADISEALQKQFDKRILLESGLLQPGGQPLAWFEISAREEQDSGKASDQAVRMSQFFDLDEQQVEERTGWKVTRKPVQTSSPSFGAVTQPTGYRAERGAAAPHPGKIQEAAEALMADLAPVRALIGDALRDCGGDLRKAVEKIAAGLPDLQAKLTSGALDVVLEGTMAEAIAETLAAEAAGGAQARRRE
jgi:phage gp29-like protein